MRARGPSLCARRLPGCVALACALALLAPSAPASAHGPRYALTIVEGETTFPEYEQPASTSGGVSPEAQVAVSIIRGGLTVYRSVDNGWAWLSQVPQVGDTVTLESPVGTLIASVVYDGLPTIDPTVCAGSTNFSGENSPGDTVEGFYKILQLGPYNRVRQTGFGEAQVKTLSGTTFGGSFLVPLEPGETVGAVEALKTPLAGEATYTYTSELERPVGTCPAPPPVYSPPPPPVPPALAGAIAKFMRNTIHAVLQVGFRDQVRINQAGTVTQALYAKVGALPASASSHPHHAPPAVLLARGSASAKGPGTVTVILRPTAKGRRKLKDSRVLQAELLTTLRSSAGVSVNLARRSVTLHR